MSFGNQMGDENVNHLIIVRISDSYTHICFCVSHGIQCKSTFKPFFQKSSILLIDKQTVWFGIVVLLAMEMSLTTPPFGLLLFLMTGVTPPNPDGTRVTFQQVVSAAIPFLACDLLLLILLIVFPAVALWLPRMVG